MRSIYQDIAERTAGDIYIGVVGPARTGKSTFIKRFMEGLVLPNIPDDQRRARARDELPQSGSGRTVMTAEPKFVPEEAVELALEGGGTCAVRLIDCVGYLVPGAVGQYEDDQPRMVRTPWSADEMPMAEAAELGTRRVIAEHSTIGVVVTTDGTITDLPREAYVDAERRVIAELKELGKPFLILVNSARPESEGAQALRDALAQEHGVTCLAVSCLELGQRAVEDVIRSVLYEFPVGEVALWLPAWVDALEADSPIRAAVLEAIRGAMDGLHKIRDVAPAVAQIGTCPLLSEAQVTGLDLGTGRCTARLELPSATNSWMSPSLMTLLVKVGSALTCSIIWFSSALASRWSGVSSLSGLSNSCMVAACTPSCSTLSSDTPVALLMRTRRPSRETLPGASGLLGAVTSTSSTLTPLASRMGAMRAATRLATGLAVPAPISVTAPAMSPVSSLPTACCLSGVSFSPEVARSLWPASPPYVSSA